MNTKAVQLTEDEVEAVIKYHASEIFTEIASEHIERMKYLDKRLQDFKEPEVKGDNKQQLSNVNQGGGTSW